MWATRPATKKRGLALLGAIDELVGDHHVERLVLFLERAHRRDGQDPLNTDLFHCVDVRPVVQLVGQDAVAAAMAGQESHALSLQGAQDEVVGGGAERSVRLQLPDIGQSLHLVQAATADDADIRALSHCLTSNKGAIVRFPSPPAQTRGPLATEGDDG